jgi:prepilin-type N-terminal cleavage/methylation domain-containing protein
MRKKLNNKGFTLIELLIVIIIIGILAAIAFVAFSSSTKKAHKADAQSTVASVKNKIGEYSTDNDGNYPADKAAVETYLNDANGGNSPALATTFGDAGYTYAATAAGGGACDNTTTPCSNFTITASATSLGFNSPDVSTSN